MRTRQLATPALWIAGIVVLGALPAFIRNPFQMHILIQIAMYSVLAMGLRLIMTTGQINLGHAGFMLVGAFASVLLVMRAGLSFWLVLPLSGLIAAAFALIVGVPTLRIKGVYFFIVTFALGELLIRITQAFPTLLGGFYGIQNVPRPNPIAIPGLFRIDFASKVDYYYLILAIAIIAAIVLLRFENSRLGKTLAAIGKNDSLAASLGVNLMGYKLLAFSVGCFFAGVAGSFYGHYNLYISGDSFTTFTTIAVLTYVVVGGLGKFWGPVLGTVFMVLLDQVLHKAGRLEVVLFGGILIMVIMFLPGGLVSIPDVVARRFRRTKKEVSNADAAAG